MEARTPTRWPRHSGSGEHVHSRVRLDRENSAASSRGSEPGQGQEDHVSSHSNCCRHRSGCRCDAHGLHAETTRAPAQIDAALQQVTAKLAIPPQRRLRRDGRRRQARAAASSRARSHGGRCGRTRPARPPRRWWSDRADPAAPSEQQAPRRALPTRRWSSTIEVARRRACAATAVYRHLPRSPSARSSDSPTSRRRRGEATGVAGRRLRLLKEARGALRVGDGARALERVRTPGNSFREARWRKSATRPRSWPCARSIGPTMRARWPRATSGPTAIAATAARYVQRHTERRRSALIGHHVRSSLLLAIGCRRAS